MIVVVNETTSLSSSSNDGSFLKISTISGNGNATKSKKQTIWIGPSITTLLETLGL